MASLDTWRQLLAAAREQRANNAALAETQARLGVAGMSTHSASRRALEHLKAVTALKPQEPYSALALAYLRLGEAHDCLGARTAALAAYKSAIAAVPQLDPYEVRSRASERMRHTPNPRHAEAFRLSLDGWRRLERNDLPGAANALERAIALDPHDPVARYRLGRVLQTRHNDVAALTQYHSRSGTAGPAPRRSSATRISRRRACTSVWGTKTTPSLGIASRRRCSAHPPTARRGDARARAAQSPLGRDPQRRSAVRGLPCLIVFSPT